jgi:hypothetical protein
MPGPGRGGTLQADQFRRSRGSARHWRKSNGAAETIRVTRRLERSVVTVMQAQL